MADTKVQLPKAYLRLDPNVDQTHPDPEGLIRLMCAANRQPQRGRFKSRAIVEMIVGRARAKRFIERGDLKEQKDGRFYLDSWDEWQEGDLTVGERQRRIRAKRAGDVIEPLPDRDTTVTEPLPDPPADRYRPSEALDVKAEDVEAIDALAGATSRAIGSVPVKGIDGTVTEVDVQAEIPPDVTRLQKLAEGLTGRPYVMANTESGMARKAIEEQLQPHGFDRVQAAWRRIAASVKAAGTSTPTLRQLVIGADDILNPIVRPDAKEERDEDTRAAFDRRVARTKALISEYQQ